MSQVTHPTLVTPRGVEHRRIMWAAGLLALAAVAVVVLVLVLGGDSSGDARTVEVGAQPTLRSDGGPEETALAAAIASRPARAPDESLIAASISGR